jgi:hypothetical protein
MLVLELLQLPPLTALLKAVVEPSQTDAVPVIEPALGSALTVAVVVVLAVPQPFVTL